MTPVKKCALIMLLVIVALLIQNIADIVSAITYNYKLIFTKNASIIKTKYIMAILSTTLYLVGFIMCLLCLIKKK
jgi:hypothetical protein